MKIYAVGISKIQGLSLLLSFQKTATERILKNCFQKNYPVKQSTLRFVNCLSSALASCCLSEFPNIVVIPS